MQRLGKALQVHMDDITQQPLPRRWVDLIHYLDDQERNLDDQERKRSTRQPTDGAKRPN